MMGRSILTFGLLVTLFAATTGSAADPEAKATAPGSIEQNVQAVFVTKFPFFVEWPQTAFATAQAQFRLCLFGDAPFADDIEEVARKRGVNGRTLEVSRPVDLNEVRRCHLLFVGPSENNRIVEILRSLEGAAVLTVSPSEGFTRAGGMIGFVRSGGRVGFEINVDAARRAGLAISSQLLKLAAALPGD